MPRASEAGRSDENDPLRKSLGQNAVMHNTAFSNDVVGCGPWLEGSASRRREFVALLGGAAVACPLIAEAQQSPIHPLIALLSPLSAAAARPLIAAFRSALRDLGYLEGRNLMLALRYGDGAPERMLALARELVALNPNVIVTGAPSGALAAHNATETIPIVMITTEDPVASGLANSIARPGRNITGMWVWGDDGLVGKRLDFLKLAVPGLARVAAVVYPDDPIDARPNSTAAGGSAWSGLGSPGHRGPGREQARLLGRRGHACECPRAVRWVVRILP